MRHLLKTALIAGILAMVLGSGCARKEPLDREVKAGSREEFERWTGKLSTELTSEHAKDLELAVQEIKILVMAQKGRGGAELLDEGMRELVKGKTVRDALRLGLQARRDRMEMERGEVRKRLEHDSSLKVREGDTESAAYLERITRAEADRLQSLTAEIARLDAKLKQLELAQP